MFKVDPKHVNHPRLGDALIAHLQNPVPYKNPAGEIELWGCGNCGKVYVCPLSLVEGRLVRPRQPALGRESAVNCSRCAPIRCAHGLRAPQDYCRLCSDARLGQRNIERAAKAQSVHVDDLVDGFWVAHDNGAGEERHYADMAAYFDEAGYDMNLREPFAFAAKRAYPTVSELDLERLVDDLLPSDVEGGEMLKLQGRAELLAAFERFNAAQTDYWFVPDYTRVCYFTPETWTELERFHGILDADLVNGPPKPADPSSSSAPGMAE